MSDLKVNPVVDTCVIIDMFDPDSPRHQSAKRLGDYLIKNGLSAIMPWTGMFEINRAFLNIRQRKVGHQLSRHFGEDNTVRIEQIPIDKGFFKKYFLPDLPYTKAGDMLFLSIAKVDARPLITEDGMLRKAAAKAQVQAFTAEEYLSAMRM